VLLAPWTDAFASNRYSMSTHRLVFKSGLTVGTGQVVTQLCSFVRNVIVARLISPQNYGIAAFFAMTFSLVELMSSLGMENFLIQAKDGNEPRFQGTAHLLLALRGLINASCIFLLAGPISSLFGVPQACWAFRCLALAPFIRGWNHLDTFRFQREMRFRPAVTVDIASNIAVTLLALPLCWWRRDYSAMLWILILQAATSRIAANLVAERPYRWAWDSRVARRILTFGWPLLINGFLMLIIFEGDRFVIGAAKRLFARSPYTLADLGIYSVAFALTMAPATMVGNISSSLFLPVLSKVQSSLPEFEKRYAYCAQAISLVAALIAIPFIVAGGWFVILIYGAKYVLAASFIGWLAAMWALRTVRGAPTVAAMARGDTRNSMVSNIARTLALPGVLLAAATGGGIVWIAISGFVGELLALAVCVGRLQREHSVSAKLFLKPFAVSAGGMVLAGIVAATATRHLGWFLSLSAAAGLVLLQFLSMLFAFPGLRKQLGQVISHAQGMLDAEKVPA
jgi:O-antigen/teichoic acid export membrane protein